MKWYGLQDIGCFMLLFFCFFLSWNYTFTYPLESHNIKLKNYEIFRKSRDSLPSWISWLQNYHSQYYSVMLLLTLDNRIFYQQVKLWHILASTWFLFCSVVSSNDHVSLFTFMPVAMAIVYPLAKTLDLQFWPFELWHDLSLNTISPTALMK